MCLIFGKNNISPVGVPVIIIIFALQFARRWIVGDITSLYELVNNKCDSSITIYSNPAWSNSNTFNLENLSIVIDIFLSPSISSSVGLLLP